MCTLLILLCDCVCLLWQAAGEALGMILTGYYSPAGRLPFTWPASVSQVRQRNTQLKMTFNQSKLFLLQIDTKTNLKVALVSSIVQGQCMRLLFFCVTLNWVYNWFFHRFLISQTTQWWKEHTDTLPVLHSSPLDTDCALVGFINYYFNNKLFVCVVWL